MERMTAVVLFELYSAYQRFFAVLTVAHCHFSVSLFYAKSNFVLFNPNPAKYLLKKKKLHAVKDEIWTTYKPVP